MNVAGFEDGHADEGPAAGPASPPEGSVVKRSAVAPQMLVHEGPARVFESEEDAQSAIKIFLS